MDLYSFYRACTLDVRWLPRRIPNECTVQQLRTTGLGQSDHVYSVEHVVRLIEIELEVRSKGAFAPEAKEGVCLGWTERHVGRDSAIASSFLFSSSVVVAVHHHHRLEGTRGT
jgi:hypothetical protein